MKNMLIYLFLCLFLFSAVAFGIDKKENKKITVKEADKKTTQKLKTSSTDKSSGNNLDSRSTRDYNDFVDRNNNGIDDRVEKTKKKASADKKQLDQQQKPQKISPEKKSK
jgi:preprotein translocase subunit SecF